MALFDSIEKLGGRFLNRRFPPPTLAKHKIAEADHCWVRAPIWVLGVAAKLGKAEEVLRATFLPSEAN